MDEGAGPLVCSSGAYCVAGRKEEGSGRRAVRMVTPPTYALAVTAELI